MGIPKTTKQSERCVRWKYLVYPGLREHSYRIYEDGSLYSMANKIWITPYQDTKGYLMFSAWIDGKLHHVRLNRILAMMFIPKTKADKERHRDIVHFIDYDNTNYSLDNLKWVSNLELNILNTINEKQLAKTPTQCRKYVLRLAKHGYSADEIIYALGFKDTKATYTKVEQIINNAR